MSEYFPHGAGLGARGGVEYRAYYIARELAKHHEVTVYTTFEEGVPVFYDVDGIRVVSVPPKSDYSHSSNISKRLQFTLNASRVLRRERNDLVDSYSHMAYPAGWNSNSRIKFVTYHDVWKGRWSDILGPRGFFGEILESYNLSRGWDHFISVSQYTKDNLIAAGIDADRISVIHNGVDCKRFSEINVEKRDVPTICVVARLVQYKRVGDVILALKKLSGDFPDLRLEVVGSGPLREDLVEMSRRMGLSERIVFHGFVESHMDVIRILKSCHCFVLPSVIEGFGMTPIEAMACGIPYAASDIPPIREATGGGRGGVLYEPGDIGALTSAITDILEGRVRPDPDFARERYDWGGIASQVRGLYESYI